MRVLITGGAGFVGSNLALALRADLPGAEVICLDNLYRRGSELNVPRLAQAGVQFHRGDVRDANSFPAGPFDFLVECSAEPSVLAGQDGSPDYLFQTNLVGAYHCLEKARQWRAGLVFLSTSRVYPIATLARGTDPLLLGGRLWRRNQLARRFRRRGPARRPLALWVHQACRRTVDRGIPRNLRP